MGAQKLGSRAIIGMFYEALEQQTGANWLSRVAMPFSSDQSSEEYRWLSSSPKMREWIGQRMAKGLRDNGITIVNKKWEATMEMPVDWLRRDKTGQIRIRIGEMADRAAAHYASLVSTLINNGAGSSSGLAYDGQYFFDTDHYYSWSGDDGGSQSNDLTSSDYGEFNVATAANPTASEMADVIMKIVQHFFTFKDDQNEPINELASDFLIMVPIGMWGATQTAITSNLLNTGSGARDNPLQGLGINITPVANARLTGTTTVYGFRTDGRTKPFIQQEEEALSVAAIAEGSELEFAEDIHHYGLKKISNVGYGMWQHAILATLS